MKNITITLTACFLLNLAGYAQETFIKLYGEPHEVDCYSFAPTDDGGYIFACTNSDHNSDMYFFRVDASGNTIWTKEYDLHPLGYGWNYVFSIDSTFDGNFIVGAFEGNEGFLMKMDPQGDTLWTRMFEGNYSGWMHSVHEVDEGFIIGQNSPNQIMKTDPDGELLWAHAYNTLGTFTLHSLSVASDGYLACGSLYDPDNSNMNENFYVMKVDTEGEVQWVYTEGETSDEVATDVIETSEQGALALGYRLHPETYQWRGYIVKFNAWGDTVWTRNLDDSPFYYLYSVEETGSGEFIITGTVTPYRADAILLMKYDSDGNEIWREYYIPEHNPQYEFNVGVEVRIRDDGYIALAANCSMTNYSQAGFLLTDPDGLITRIPKVQGETSDVKAYPNPFREQIHFSTIESIKANPELRIFDSSGKLVYQFDAPAIEKKTDIYWNGRNKLGQELPQGVYFYQIKNSKELISQGKIIKQ